MSILKQILGLHLLGTPLLRIAEAVKASRNTVRKYIQQIEKTGHSLEELSAMAEEQLYALLNRPPDVLDHRLEALEDLFPFFEKELRRTGVNRMVLWGEYRRQHPDGYNYSRFCDHYRQWHLGHQGTMHVEHEPGDKIYMDFTGKKMWIANPLTGERQEAEMFLASLGYSHYTYAEPVASQAKDDLYEVVCNALEYFGGVARAFVPDNMKTAVTTACNYEPLVDRDFIDLANHYGATVIPARGRKPRDKAIVENAVSIVYSRIFAPLRDDTFHSLESLKRAVRDRLEVYNAMPFQQRQGSRQSVFEQEEKALLKPLPAERFERRTYKELTVMKNGHVLLYEDRHYYSVPYRYIGKKVRLVYSARHVSAYFQHERIAYHPRNKKRNGYSTIKDHLSSTHRFVSDWNADRFIAWAGAIAPEVREYVTRILDDAPHPEQAYKSCVGILSQDRKVGRQRLIRAVKRAILYGAYNYTTIRKILQSGLDNLDPEQEERNNPMPGHQNIRGPQAYQ